MSVPYSRVTALLSFYDEPVELLAAHVASLAGVVDHLVAVDGAYMLFPEGKPSSDPQQMRIITEVARGLRIGLTTHTPTTTWIGNEVAKRNHVLKLAELVTREDGWYLVLDADCIVTGVHPEWFQVVEKVANDGYGAMNIGVREVQNIPGVTQTDTHAPVRLMYRAVRGLEYGPSHWTVSYEDPDAELGRTYLWGDRSFRPVDAYDGTSYLRIDHRHEVTAERDLAQRQYYARRDKLGIESPVTLHVRGLDGSFKPIDGNRSTD